MYGTTGSILKPICGTSSRSSRHARTATSAISCVEAGRLQIASAARSAPQRCLRSLWAFAPVNPSDGAQVRRFRPRRPPGENSDAYSKAIGARGAGRAVARRKKNKNRERDIGDQIQYAEYRG